MPSKIQARDCTLAFLEFAKTNSIPALKIGIVEDKEFKGTHLHETFTDVSLDEFLSFCKKLSVLFFTYCEFVLEKSMLEEIKENDDESEDDEDGDDELELSPKAKSIIEASIKKHLKNLQERDGQVGCTVIYGHKEENVFKFVISDDWYDLFVKLTQVYENLEENGPEILTSDEILKFNQEVGIRESRESIMKRREAELEAKKEKYFNDLSVDRIFLNSKTIALRGARAEKLMPKNLDEFIDKREAAEEALNLFMQRVEKMRSEGKSSKDIASAVGVSESMLKKYVDLG
jgi:hypothetical protein